VRPRDLLLVVAATIGAGLITFAILALRRGALQTLSAATADIVTGHSSSHSELPATSSAENWNGSNRKFWLGNQKGAAFELLSENKVSTFFGPTQPVLVVRCSSRMAEAFVYTRSPTKIEPHAEGKTVTVSIDGEPAKTERWSDSDDRVALFSPDGAAFAHRLMHASTLRFGYSPHNADDVVAQFHIAGLAELLNPVARQCGWTPEETGARVTKTKRR